MAAKDAKTGPQPKSVVPVILSVASLCVSAVALWYSALAPPDIVVTVSSPAFLWQGPAEETERRLYPSGSITSTSSNLLMMKAECTFANNGARIGTVSSFALKFKADDGTDWIVSPYWVADEKQIAQGGDKTFSNEGPFAPIVVAGKQTVSQSYLFIVERAGGGKITLVPRLFHVTVYSWAAGEEEPREQQEMAINMDENVILALNSSQGQWGSVPSQEERQRIRNMPSR